MNKDRERGERRGKGEGRGFRRRGMGRRKVCRFCADKTMLIDYKDSRTLGNFLSERGKITPRRISGRGDDSQTPGQREQRSIELGERDRALRQGVEDLVVARLGRLGAHVEE